MWPTEPIPNEAPLYFRVHRVFFRDGELDPGVFKDHPDGPMSVDWSEYAKARDTLRRATSPRKDNGVVQMKCGDVRAIPPLAVEHTPEAKNRAHSEVRGKKTTKVRFLLLQIVQW